MFGTLSRRFGIKRPLVRRPEAGGLKVMTAGMCLNIAGAASYFWERQVRHGI
ncbi:MAG: hypothetical protein LBW85_03250 [Deltaproteobacteria bacterium]|jgi:hypothetical protein|nr:hypothetical protein [Deltaproteobacteria bacterium]